MGITIIKIITDIITGDNDVALSKLGRWIFGNQLAKNESALDILKKRYAAGEINEQEFSEIKVALSSEK